jgi:hypothetical protein
MSDETPQPGQGQISTLQPQQQPGWQPQPPPTDQTTAPRHRRRRWPWIVGSIVVAVILISVFSPSDNKDKTPTATQPATSAPSSPAPSNASSPTNEPTVTQEEPAAQEPISYSGHGDKILKIKIPDSSGIGFAKITHRGSSNFFVKSVETDELLINEIGLYSGRVMFDTEEGQQTKRLKITADGSWTVKTLPMESLRTFDAKIRGSGDDVIVYTGNEGVAKIKHAGESNFVVQAYGDSSELLVNEIGNYSGEQLFTDASVVQITADGKWSISVTA